MTRYAGGGERRAQAGLERDRVRVLQRPEAEVALAIVLLVVDEREAAVERRNFWAGWPLLTTSTASLGSICRT